MTANPLSEVQAIGRRLVESWRAGDPAGGDDVAAYLDDLLARDRHALAFLDPPSPFVLEDGYTLRRPERTRRLTFADLWVRRTYHVADLVPPLEHARPGDRQVAVYGRRGDTFDPTVVDIDGLAELPDVESVAGMALVRARRPLPHVRELLASPVDDETLANLPNLESFAPMRRRYGHPPLTPDAVAPGLRWVLGNPFETLEELTRYRSIERLGTGGLYRDSAEPLAELRRLRWLDADPGKGLRHLAKLEELELLDLDLQEGPALPNLKRFKTLRNLRFLRIDGRNLRSIEGIEALRSLEALWLYRPGITTLAPLAELPALAHVRLDGPDKVEDFEPLAALPALRRIHVELHSDARSHIAWARELERRRPGAEVSWWEPIPEPPPDVLVGRIGIRRLPDGTWSIFQDVTDLLGVGTNHEAEDGISRAIRRDDPTLHARLIFDSEAGALGITSDDEAAIRAAAAFIDAMAAPD